MIRKRPPFCRTLPIVSEEWPSDHGYRLLPLRTIDAPTHGCRQVPTETHGRECVRCGHETDRQRNFRRKPDRGEPVTRGSYFVECPGIGESSDHLGDWGTTRICLPQDIFKNSHDGMVPVHHDRRALVDHLDGVPARDSPFEFLNEFIRVCSGKNPAVQGKCCPGGDHIGLAPPVTMVDDTVSFNGARNTRTRSGSRTNFPK